MKVLKLTLFILCIIATARFTHHQTHGFRLSKIRQNLCPEQEWHTLQKVSHDVFEQKYFYLGRGLQSFAFASEDGRYVIKIFNNRYQRWMDCYLLCSHVPLLGSWAKKHHAYFQAKLLKTFSSYEIADEKFREESGLIFTHLNATSTLPNRLILVDPLHIEHAINPNEHGFIIQKRASMVYPTLLHYIEEGKIETAQQAISSLIDLFIAKYQKGIADNDPLIRTNYGFIGNTPLQIDVGPFTNDPQMAKPTRYSQEIWKATRSLKNWLSPRSPELALFLEKTLEMKLQQSSEYQ